jgi:RNA polymerase sigma-70 factor (ECF subfamily)
MVDKLDEYESVEALATAITRNYCIDRLRRSDNKNRIRSDRTEYESYYESPYEWLERSESYNLIHSVIEKLPEPYRKIIELREIEGLSYSEISLKVNKKINTLRVIISRARNMIKIEYEKCQYEQKEAGQASR